MLQLPSECILHILTRLPFSDVVSVASSCTALRQLAADDCFWASFAEAKWGSAVPKDLQQLHKATLEDASVGEATIDLDRSKGTGSSWQQYCYKRMSARTISRSPLNLLQETYPDPWQHIICCVLCSRTSGSDLIRMAISAFFDALPTPTAVLQADDGLLKDLLHPLGLQATRMAAVKSVSHGFLATDWQTPSEFHGCGKFVEDSWRIFCRGCRDSRGVADANLKAYIAWHKRLEQGQSDAADAARPTRQGKQMQKQRQKQTLQQQPSSTDPGCRGSSRQRQQQDQQRPPATAPSAVTRAALKRQRAAMDQTAAVAASH